LCQIKEWLGNVLAAVYMMVSKGVTVWKLPFVSPIITAKKLTERSVVFNMLVQLDLALFSEVNRYSPAVWV
jgi:hypothetical protein